MLLEFYFINLWKSYCITHDEMIYVELPNKKQYRLTFYLAMEEYIAREFPAQEYFFIWQVEPTVIFGRNQLVDSEVDVNYCRVTNVNFTFNRYMLMVEDALQRLGVDARTTGRNDILVDGKKVSGNAFYKLPGRSIVHGTMLYDTNLEFMVNATTPSDSKLRSKGVESVRQHVTTLNRYIDMGIDGLKEHLRSVLCSDAILLGNADIERISLIEREYLDEDFIYGNNPAASFVNEQRIEGVGEFKVSVDIKDGKVRRVSLAGDFFIIADVDAMLLDKLKGVPYTRDAIGIALKDVDTAAVIMNLQKEQLINLII